ncbi:hypothetical protein LG293_17545 (plasmid) [Citricoccus nitrophenolicus]
MDWLFVLELIFVLCGLAILIGSVGFLVWYGVCYSSPEAIRRRINRDYKEWERRQNELGR